MTFFKCKMCGGDLQILPGSTIAECEHCGGIQTLPKLDDEKIARLYDRANHFRRNNEFDKAIGIYEDILNENPEDAESYWSLVLCKYGIEYVEDPATKQRIPTVNRAQYTAIYDDDNYKSALKYADISQKLVYQQEAKQINEIQKGILDISQREEPFDVFICYKETDENGQRTRDSVTANELYHELTEEGFKVFFSRTTLEDKLGEAYEPYIFAALNSAKVMVVLGSKPEYFNAVWVKNEWSRYLSLIKAGQKKTLIPAYKDMDPYDLPQEFAHLQAQDMSKLGFMPDLIRGIRKLAGVQQPVYPPMADRPSAVQLTEVEPLLRRIHIFLESEDWTGADIYCEKVLDMEPENSEAYKCKLLAERRSSREEDLPKTDLPLDESSSYRSLLRYADEQTVQRFADYNRQIKERLENKAQQHQEKQKKEEELRRLRQAISKTSQQIAALEQEKANTEQQIQTLTKDAARYAAPEKMKDTAKKLLLHSVMYFVSLLAVGSLPEESFLSDVFMTLFFIAITASMVMVWKLREGMSKRGLHLFLAFATFGIYGAVLAILTFDKCRQGQYEVNKTELEFLQSQAKKVSTDIDRARLTLLNLNQQLRQAEQ